MSTTEIKFAEGKYSIRHESGTNLRCLRYGEAWRDLNGDGMILALAQEVEDLRAERDSLLEALRISRQSEQEAWRYKGDLTAERDSFAMAATEAQAERDAARDERDALLKDAARYRAFFDAHLPITFLGVDYRDKASLDAAIDAAMASSSKEGK